MAQRRLAADYPSVAAMLRALTPSYPVFCLSPLVLGERARWFQANFPGRVLYAVKCNPHPLILRGLHAAGIRDFDTASLPEVALVHELFDDAEAYFHHPVKSRAAIQAACEIYEATFYSIDHPDELAKVRQETRGAPVTAMVRLKTPGTGAAYDLSRKFGAEPAAAVALLRQADAIGMTVGVSFHVGSQCTRPASYREAMELAAGVVRGADVPVRYLNVGGGFPARYGGRDTPPLAEFMAEIVAARGLFAPEIELMCEPGRAMVYDSCSLVLQVALRKDDALFVNDGVYGSLSEFLYDPLFSPPVTLHRAEERPGAAERDFTVFGPTCDSNDVLPRPFRLPADVREGDWIEVGQMGAYSNALASDFNGFRAETFVTVSPPLSPA